jgi:hypothetical protein
VAEPLRRNTALHTGPASVTGGPQAGFYRPVLLAPEALFESRAEARFSLAQPAYVALVEITPDDDWRVIYPVDARAEVRLAAGEHTVRTACATEPAPRNVPPGKPVGACARRFVSMMAPLPI